MIDTAPPVTLDPALIAAEVAACDCNLALAAELLTKRYEQDPPFTPADLLYILSQNPQSAVALLQQLKVKASLDAYRAMYMTQNIVMGLIENYEAPDHIKAYTAFAGMFRDLAAPIAGTTNNVNVVNGNYTDRMLAMLPNDVQEAIRRLAVDESTPDPLAMDASGLKLPVRPTLDGEDEDNDELASLVPVKRRGRPRKQ